MLEKLVQAAIITFLLHLIAGLSPTTIKTEATPPSGTMSAPIARALLNEVAFVTPPSTEGKVGIDNGERDKHLRSR